MPTPPASTTTVEVKPKRRLRSQSSFVIQKVTSILAGLQSRNSEPNVDEPSISPRKSQRKTEKPPKSRSWPTYIRGIGGHSGQDKERLSGDATAENLTAESLSDERQCAPVSSGRRSRSFDLGTSATTEDGGEPGATNIGLLPSLSIVAPSGAGSKAQRLSISQLEERPIECLPLKNEFRGVGFHRRTGGKLLGRGATANVRLMVRKGGRHDEFYAVKEFRGRVFEEEVDYIKKIKSEYALAKSLDHPNIVKTAQLCMSRGLFNHVMEYCDQGELFGLINKRYLTQSDSLCLWKQLLRGVNYLHRNGIAHRDIKPENLLLNSAGCLKITDFGIAEVFSGVHPGRRTAGDVCEEQTGEIRKCTPGICGSLPYMAPEVLQKKGDYDPRPVDVWSCAIIFFTMRFHGSPWLSAHPEHEHYARFQKGWDDWLALHPNGKIPDPSSSDAEDLPKCGPLFQALQKPALKRLLLKMLHPHPEKRISMESALKTSFVKYIDCCSEDVDDHAKQSGTLRSPKNHGIVKKAHCHIPPKERGMILRLLRQD
ncbi:MAG: hypothetical protein M1822_006118 [Bathelium mastoideum]|nr:MAG: hypothetical protein M1822_006118 [Bathelium mastoideum]